MKIFSRQIALFSPRRTAVLWLGAGGLALLPWPALAAGWSLAESAGDPGQVVEARFDGRLIARLIYGEGQMKPYLQVFGDDGDALNKWDPKQQFPHHRGIFIGWNKLGSDLGTFDLWHFNNGGKMELVKLDKLDANATTATIVAKIVWRAGKKDADGSDLLLTETRTLILSRPDARRTQIDAHFVLQPARDLKLEGDLQHSGIHFRASAEVGTRAKETSYLWEPDLPGPGGKVASKEMKWCQLLFPIGEHWYRSLQLNPSSNPVDELSWRDYGRFGFFFKKALKKGETLPLDYRFIIERAEPPADKPKPSPEQAAKARAACQASYEAYAKALKP
jgi:hypothetical protein